MFPFYNFMQTTNRVLTSKINLIILAYQITDGQIKNITVNSCILFIFMQLCLDFNDNIVNDILD